MRRRREERNVDVPLFIPIQVLLYPLAAQLLYFLQALNFTTLIFIFKDSSSNAVHLVVSNNPLTIPVIKPISLGNSISTFISIVRSRLLYM